MLYFYVGSAWDGKSTQVDSIPCRIHGSIRNFIPHAVIDAPVGPVETLSATPKTSGERSEASREISHEGVVSDGAVEGTARGCSRP